MKCKQRIVDNKYLGLKGLQQFIVMCSTDVMTPDIVSTAESRVYFSPGCNPGDMVKPWRNGATMVVWCDHGNVVNSPGNGVQNR